MSKKFIDDISTIKNFSSDINVKNMENFIKMMKKHLLFNQMLTKSTFFEI